ITSYPPTSSRATRTDTAGRRFAHGRRSRPPRPADDARAASRVECLLEKVASPPRGTRQRGRARERSGAVRAAVEATAEAVALTAAAPARVGRRAPRPLRLPLLPTARLLLRDAERPGRTTGLARGAERPEGGAPASPRECDEYPGDAARGEADRLRQAGRTALHRQGDPCLAQGAP